MLRTGECREGQKGLERKTNICPLHRTHAVRNDIETLQSEDVIEPDCAGIKHRGAQHAAKRIKLPIFETNRIESGQTPILSSGIENIRGRTDCRSGQDGVLVAPRVKTIVAHPNGDVEIKPNGQVPRVGTRSAKVQLLVGDPLHELNKTDLCRRTLS